MPASLTHWDAGLISIAFSSDRRRSRRQAQCTRAGQCTRQQQAQCTRRRCPGSVPDAGAPLLPPASQPHDVRETIQLMQSDVSRDVRAVNDAHLAMNAMLREAFAAIDALKNRSAHLTSLSGEARESATRIAQSLGSLNSESQSIRARMQESLATIARADAQARHASDGAAPVARGGR